MSGRVIMVSGPLVKADKMENARLYEVVKIGDLGLTGEIIEYSNGVASIQVYEETSMLSVGQKVELTGELLSAYLAPGLLGGVFDGIERPLDKLYSEYGDFITRGAKIDKLDTKKLWHFVPTKKVGDYVRAGDEIGFVLETKTFKHKILVPYNMEGEITSIKEGNYTIIDIVASLEHNSKIDTITMLQKWPVRTPRPYKEKFSPSEPMITGQRVIDTLFPIARGGVCAIPGPFGSGKTVVQHQLAKFSDADVIVYVGCGERGNEIIDVINEFSSLIDPKTKNKLMDRTVLIANTSNMPVSAREASIYTGITIAEYFRDMGYNVALMADSTSRYAEALREMSARLEEMPGEEGYPAYLSSRLASFYERAGVVLTLGQEGKKGSITVIGAVSPAGGDLSEPVSQATLRIVKVYFALSSSLAYSRHFPAIDWLTSYSMYAEKLKNWYASFVGEEFEKYRSFIEKTLQEESSLLEIVRLLSSDSLSSQDRLLLETGKIIREDFLYQNAFNDEDSFSSLKKQFKMIEVIFYFYNKLLEALKKGASIKVILNLSVKEKIKEMRYISDAKLGEFDEILSQIDDEINAILDYEKDSFEGENE